MSCDKRLELALLESTAIHVTIAMFRLENELEKTKAISILKELEPILVCMLPLNVRPIKIKEIGCFNGRVIYAEVQNNSDLTKFVDIAKAKLSDAGIRLVGNHEPYNPHVTLLKLVNPIC